MTDADEPQLDTANLLAAGMAPTRTRSGRWLPPTPDQLAGAFPNLHIIELLGSGGMGAVYKARQIHLDRLVAVKLLAPRSGGDAEFDERFAREARALARLDHPNIVSVHDFGRVLDRAYLVMQHIDGSNLRQVLGTGALSGSEVLRLVRQLCDALEHAHAAGVVHRDLKPENILIDGRGNAHIADFGLAKLHEGGNELTGTGEVLGTLHYMAPEQLAAAAAVDHRADLYALGVIIYEMLTGSLPLGRFAPPSSASGVAPGVDAVVLKSLEPDPVRRYASASELRHALEGASSTAGAPGAATAPGTEGVARPATPVGAGERRPGADAGSQNDLARTVDEIKRGAMAAATIAARDAAGAAIARAAAEPGSTQAREAAEAASRETALDAHRERAQAAPQTADAQQAHGKAAPGSAAPETPRAVDAKVDPQNKPSKVRVGPDGVHIVDGDEEVRVGWDGVHIKGGKENVSVGWDGVHVTPNKPGQPAGARQWGGDHKYFGTGTFMLVVGAVLAIFLGLEHLRDFYAGPSQHFDAHRDVDLAMFASTVIVAGGVALLSRCCLPVVLLSGIASIMPIPWLWSDHKVVACAYIVYSIWLMTRICTFGRLRDHMATLPWHDRLLRLIWVLPLIAALLAVPVLPWLPFLHMGILR